MQSHVASLRDWLAAEEELNHRRTHHRSSTSQSPTATAPSHKLTTQTLTPSCFRKLASAVAAAPQDVDEAVEVVYRRALMSRLTRLDNSALLETGAAWVRFAPKSLLKRTTYTLVDACFGALEDAGTLAADGLDEESELMYEMFVHRVFEVIDALLGLEFSFELRDGAEETKDLPRRKTLLYYKLRKFLVDEKGERVRRSHIETDLSLRSFFAGLTVLLKYSRAHQFDCDKALAAALSQHPATGWSTPTTLCVSKLLMVVLCEPSNRNVCVELFGLSNEASFKRNFRVDVLTAVSRTKDERVASELLRGWERFIEDEDVRLQLFGEILALGNGSFSTKLAVDYLRIAVKEKRAQLLVLAVMNPTFDGLWNANSANVPLEVTEASVDAFESDSELIRFYAPLAYNAIEGFCARELFEWASLGTWVLGEHASRDPEAASVGFDALARLSRTVPSDAGYVRSLQGALLKFGRQKPDLYRNESLVLLRTCLCASETVVGRQALEVLERLGEENAGPRP